jgi:hypothetical protein
MQRQRQKKASSSERDCVRIESVLCIQSRVRTERLLQPVQGQLRRLVLKSSFRSQNYTSTHTTPCETRAPSFGMKKHSGRTARILRKKESISAAGGPKNLLILRGPTASALGLSALRDLAALKKPDVKLLTRTNDVRPFDDFSSLEFLADKNDCQAFLFTSHNKKRPHNLILGRLFDGHVLDMIELGLAKFVPLSEFDGAKKRIGSVPCFVFAGDEWDRNPTCARLRSMILGALSQSGSFTHDPSSNFRPLACRYIWRPRSHGHQSHWH